MPSSTGFLKEKIEISKENLDTNKSVPEIKEEHGRNTFRKNNATLQKSGVNQKSD